MKIRYYTTRSRNGRVYGYWQPTKAMRDQGFALVPCGEDGAEAWAIAAQWNKKWDAAKDGPVRSDEVGFVYFLKAGSAIKIGFSRKRPLIRISDLKTGIAESIERIVIIRATAAHERRLHRRLAAYRKNGEWFRPHAVVERMMLRASAFGIAGCLGENENRSLNTLDFVTDEQQERAA